MTGHAVQLTVYDAVCVLAADRSRDRPLFATHDLNQQIFAEIHESVAKDDSAVVAVLHYVVQAELLYQYKVSRCPICSCRAIIDKVLKKVTSICTCDIDKYL